MKFFGFSHVGKNHLNDENQTPCQDYHIVQSFNDGVIAAIADGVGSSKHSDIASRLAAEAFIEFLQNHLRLELNVTEIKSLLGDAFRFSLNKVMTYVESQNDDPINYNTTLTGLFFTKDFVGIAHSGDGGVIGLKENGLFVKLTEKQNLIEDGTAYVYPLSKTENWQFYLYEERFARILMATDGIYDAFFPSLLKNEVEEKYIKLINQFMNTEKLNQSMSDLMTYKEAFLNWVIKSDFTTDDITMILLIDESINIAKQEDSYYKSPNWDEFNQKRKKLLYPNLNIQPTLKASQTLKNNESENYIEKNKTQDHPLEINSRFGIPEKITQSKLDQEEFLDTLKGAPLNKKKHGLLKFFKRKIDNTLNFAFKNIYASIQDSFGTIINYDKKPIISNESIDIYRVNGNNPQFVILYKSIATLNENKNNQFLDNPSFLMKELRESMLYPISLAYNKHGDFIGYLAEYKLFDTPRSLQDLFQANFQDIPHFPFNKKVWIARNTAALLHFFHRQGILLKKYTPSQIGVSMSSGQVFLFDSLNLLKENSLSTMENDHQDSNLFLYKQIENRTLFDDNNFDLSIIIFQILMNGSHPFTYEKNGLITIQGTSESSYKSNLFLKDVNFTEPIGPFSTKLFNPEIYKLFFDLYTSDNLKIKQFIVPDSLVWYNALNGYFNTLIPCDMNPNHIYPSHMAHCPWCEN